MVVNSQGDTLYGIFQVWLRHGRVIDINCWTTRGFFQGLKVSQGLRPSKMHLWLFSAHPIYNCLFGLLHEHCCVSWMKTWVIFPIILLSLAKMKSYVKQIYLNTTSLSIILKWNTFSVHVSAHLSWQNGENLYLICGRLPIDSDTIWEILLIGAGSYLSLSLVLSRPRFFSFLFLLSVLGLEYAQQECLAPMFVFFVLSASCLKITRQYFLVIHSWKLEESQLSEIQGKMNKYISLKPNHQCLKSQFVKLTRVFLSK